MYEYLRRRLLPRVLRAVDEPGSVLGASWKLIDIRRYYRYLQMSINILALGSVLGAGHLLDDELYIDSISAPPTACPLRGHGRTGTQNDRLSEAAILSTGTPIPAQ